jgi:hypothetical protein
VTLDGIAAAPYKSPAQADADWFDDETITRDFQQLSDGETARSAIALVRGDRRPRRR